jgi:hypothetical protein
MEIAPPATCGGHLAAFLLPAPLHRPISAAPPVDLRRQGGSEVWEEGAEDLDHGGEGSQRLSRGLVPPLRSDRGAGRSRDTWGRG